MAAGMQTKSLSSAQGTPGQVTHCLSGLTLGVDHIRKQDLTLSQKGEEAKTKEGPEPLGGGAILITILQV